MILQFTKTLLVFVVIASIAFGESRDESTIPPSPTTTELPAMLSPGMTSSAGDVTKMTPSWQMTPIPTTETTTWFRSLTVATKGWFVRGESMFLQLSHGRNQPLAYGVIDTSQNGSGTFVPFGPVLATNDISRQEFFAVPRITLGYRNDNGTGLEATYFGQNAWTGSAFATSAPNAVPPIIFLETPDTLLVRKAAASLASALNSFEVNAFESFEHLPSLELLAGLRYFDLTERFEFCSERNLTGGPLKGHYDLGTGNHLYGAQLGLRWGSRWNRLSFSGTVKSGVYANAASQDQFFGYSRNANEAIVRNLSTTKTGMAFIQELGINGIYQLTDAWSFRAGYNLFVVSGLSRATNQIDFSLNPGSYLSTHGTAVLHGPSAGIEFRF